jgi:hypothetical protein
MAELPVSQPSSKRNSDASGPPTDSVFQPKNIRQPLTELSPNSENCIKEDR